MERRKPQGSRIGDVQTSTIAVSMPGARNPKTGLRMRLVRQLRQTLKTGRTNGCQITKQEPWWRIPAVRTGDPARLSISQVTTCTFFRDLEESKAKKLKANTPALRLAASRSDPILDNLPPLAQERRSWVLPERRRTLESLKVRFLQPPGGFADLKSSKC